MMLMSIIDKTKDFLNSIGKELVEFAFGWLAKVPPMMQALILIGLAILSIIGLISLIRWSFKIVIPLAILAILAILLWTFVL